MRRLAILGASGHGKVVADASSLCGWEVTFFDDAWPRLDFLGPWRVVGTSADLLRGFDQFDGVVVAIGRNSIRLAHHRDLTKRNHRLVSIIHPGATVSRWAEIGAGSVVCAGAVVSSFARIGEACIVNTGASVDHDCVLQDAVHLSPGARLGGGVHIGESSWVGIGAVVKHGLHIGANVVVGAGAAVIRDAANGSTLLGVPASSAQLRPR